MKKNHSDRRSSFVTTRRASVVEPLEQRTLMYAATVGVNADAPLQTIEGFGAAMKTWTQMPEYSQASFYDLIVNDLGATAARTSVWPTFERSNDNNDPNSFNWAAYDKNALATAMLFLKRLQDRGMDQFLATVWTPPPFMKTNQSHYYGGTVRPDMRAEFAEYVAAVAISAQRDFGVDLSHISPQNEPFFIQEFESTGYTDVQMREIVRSMTRKLAAEGLDTQIIAPEDMAKGERYKWYVDGIMNDPETANFPGSWGVHSANTPHWPEVAEAVAGTGHSLWMTESHGHAQTIDGALLMAQDMWNALTQANASAYLYWQWSERAGDAQHSLMIDGQPAIKYHVAKHFYRYVRPGAVRIDGAASTDARARTVSFKHPESGAVTHVLFNRDASNPADITLNLSGSGLPDSYKQYRTSGTENHVQLANVSGTTQLTVTLPANSIVTLYSGPDLQPVAATSAGPLPDRQTIRDAAITNDLRIASVQGNLARVQELLAAGFDVNDSAFGGYTPLHAAASSPYAGATSVIHALLDAGANPELKTSEGFTPLHYAAMNTWTRGGTQAGPLAGDRIRALTGRGASVTATDNKGRTPLHWGAMMTKLSSITSMTTDRVVVDALLDAASAVNATDNAGFTPLDYAVREGNTAGIDELKDRGGVHGAGDPAGNGDTTPPTANVLNVSPDPRTTAVDSVDVRFSESVSGVDAGDFIFMRDGTTQSLAGATVTQLDATTWRVGNLAALTGAAGAYMLKLEKAGSGITDAAGNALATSASDEWTVTSDMPPPPPGQTPYKGSPFAVGSTPVTIQAEDYDLGGQGVAFNDTTTNNIGGAYRPTEPVDIKPIAGANGQFRISDAITNEWLEYTVDVAQAGAYTAEFRVGNRDAGSTFSATLGGVSTGTMSVPDTNSYDAFTTITKTLNLAAGEQVLRFTFENPGTGGYGAAFDWIKLTQQVIAPTAPATPSGLAADGSTSGIQIDWANNVEAGLAGYNLYRSDTAGGTYSKVNTTGLLTTSAYNDTSMPAGATRFYRVTAVNSSGNESTQSAPVSATRTAVADPQQPYKGEPYAVGSTPVIIQAEDYDLGGQGIAYNDTTASNIGGTYRNDGVDIKNHAPGQHRISDAVAGEWLEYTIDVAQAGEHEIEFRVSHADPNSRFHVELGGVDLTGSLTAPDTNSHNTFTSVKKTVTLGAGQQVLRFAYDAGASNGYAASFDWMKIAQIAPQQPPPQPPPEPGTTVTIASDVVTYVRDGASANTNFGASSEMLVKDTGIPGANANREGYLKFDLTGVTTIGNAMLRLHGRVDGTSTEGVNINVHGASNTTWAEDGLTWNNKPPADAVVHGSLTVRGSTGQWYDVDLTSFLQSERAAGRTTVTLVLKGATVSNPWAIFGTESTPNGPQLGITA